MTQRSRTTFAKRQKEQARQEKQRAKFQRRLEKKLDRQDASGPGSSQPSESPEDLGAPLQPLAFDAVPDSSPNASNTEEQS